jgi:sec-independent protein translocase protein TatB
VRGLRAYLDSAKERAVGELADEEERAAVREEWRRLDPRQYDPRTIVRDALASPSETSPSETSAAATAASVPTAPVAPSTGEEAPVRRRPRYDSRGRVIRTPA